MSFIEWFFFGKSRKKLPSNALHKKGLAVQDDGHVKPPAHEVNAVDTIVNVNEMIERDGMPDSHGYEGSRLWYAARDGDVDKVQKYVKLGADLNAIGHFGAVPATPLMAAIDTAFSSGGRFSLPIVKILIAAGANVNFVTYRGETVLYWAIFKINYFQRPDIDLIKLVPRRL